MAPIDLEKRSPATKKLFSVSNLYGLSLLVALVWGSVVLINSLVAIYTRDIVGSLQSLGESSKYVYPWQVENTEKLLTLDVWRSGVFTPNVHRVQWIHSPESITNDQGTYLVVENDESQENVYVIRSILDENFTHTLFSGSSFKYHGIHYTIDDLTASPDLTRAFIKTNREHGWRHSSSALFWILDVESQSVAPLYNTHDRLSFATWSPTSDKIAFVFDNNVYVKDILSGTISQITNDGSANVFNGKPDWVYEEEVFASESVLWWSPDGRVLSFLKFNDASVPEFPIPFYAQPGHEFYPKMVTLKYPKPGFSNPIVDLIIAHLPESSGSAFKLRKVHLPSEQIQDKIITEVLWVSNDKVLVKTTNRASDILEIFLVPALENKPASMVRSHNATDAWFEVGANAIFVPKDTELGRYTDGYIDVIEYEGFNHLAYFLPPENPRPFMLTGGAWEVLTNYVDLQKNIVYFTATLASSVERHFYSVDLLDVFHHKGLPEVTPITNGTKWFSGSFSSGSRFLLLNDMGPGVPLQQLVDLHSGKVIQTLEENKNVQAALNEFDLPTSNVSVVTLHPEDSKTPIKAFMVEILPPSFDPSKKYPVLFYVYGGPGSQLVTQTFAIGFSHVVAAQLNAVVVTVDGRGTGFNNINPDLGSRYKFSVRDRLGHFEPNDQIAAAKEWASRPYVDESRIAIWGWSYGGFLTLKTLEKDTDSVFSYGVSVAPVTQWRLYDSIYTERYLRTPEENPEGYHTASVTNAESFKNVTRFLMMHGSGDDNVHFQNSLRLLDEFNLHLVENFDFMVFPDSDHSMGYHNGYAVIFDRILDWLGRAFSDDFVRMNSRYCK